MTIGAVSDAQQKDVSIAASQFEQVAPNRGCSPPIPALNRAMKDEMSRRHIPGMAAVVTRGEKILRTGYYGLADIEHNVPVSAAMCYFEMVGPRPGFGWATLTEDGKVSFAAIDPR